MPARIPESYISNTCPPRLAVYQRAGQESRTPKEFRRFPEKRLKDRFRPPPPDETESLLQSGRTCAPWPWPRQGLSRWFNLREGLPSTSPWQGPVGTRQNSLGEGPWVHRRQGGASTRFTCRCIQLIGRTVADAGWPKGDGKTGYRHSKTGLRALAPAGRGFTPESLAASRTNRDSADEPAIRGRGDLSTPCHRAAIRGL